MGVYINHKNEWSLYEKSKKISKKMQKGSDK